MVRASVRRDQEVARELGRRLGVRAFRDAGLVLAVEPTQVVGGAEEAAVAPRAEHARAHARLLRRAQLNEVDLELGGSVLKSPQKLKPFTIGAER